MLLLYNAEVKIGTPIVKNQAIHKLNFSLSAIYVSSF